MYISKIYQYAVDSYGNVRTLVRGLPFQCPEDWEEILDSLDENSNLYLVKEPDNPEDKLAIAAYLDDRRIGYVATSDNGKIWLYMTDKKIPCQFIERFEASFKIAFENPRNLFDGIPFEEIYQRKDSVTEKLYPAFDIPFLTNPKDNNYVWFDDKTYIMDLEKFIPDFRRKLASRMIILVGRRNGKGEYCYYLPYSNSDISEIKDDIIKGLVDKYGFVIALPDVPMMTHQDLIFMDLHVTYIKNTNFKEFNLAHQSELMFSLTKDYKENVQKSACNQGGADENHDYKQRLSTNEDDKFMQNPLSTPSYSKQDYVLKKGELTDYSIDRKTFNKIDKITSELYTFVRKNLFPSMELFSYLKKHTAYWNLFHDFDEYETLIRIFTIKDLGRIYKGLNHSFNFDTPEGKLLFLYMDKDVGGTTDISYESFTQICDTRIKLEAAIKLRKIIEDLMKSFYEYEIELCTDNDLIIYSFLKEVDNELAKRYVDLMRQFASVIADTKEQTLESSPHSERNAPFCIDEFFPLFGVTLGKTTCKEAEEMGYPLIKWPNGKQYVSIGDLSFDDSERKGIFTTLCMNKRCDPLPLKWKSKGFSWDNSYDEWVDVFKTLGYEINVTCQPYQEFVDLDTGEILDSSVLYAKFEALSPDGILLFKMDFNNGEDGDKTYSPRTLDRLVLEYKGI